MSIERKPSKIELALLLTPIRKYIEATYQIEVIQNDTVGLKPPYIILGNHVTNWDPLFINCYVKEPICFVAASQIFQQPIMQKVLNYAGAISKTKGRADSSTIRNILRAKKASRVIGIFPEGNRTWNGQTEPIILSTAKLVRSLNIPVVIATIEGGYLSQPRWSDSVRQGKVHLSFKQLWQDGEVKSLAVEDIHEALTKALYVNDFAWQQRMNQTFTGKNLAHYLERYLFTCPSCKNIHCMHSQEDLFSCKLCSYTVRYNEKGLFEGITAPPHFENIIDWNNWQLEQIGTHAVDALKDQVTLAQTTGGVFVKQGDFTISCCDGTLFLCQGKHCITIMLSSITSVNIHKHHKIDFYTDDTSYHLTFTNERASAYMWYQLISYKKNS